jgi:hypothetical protein
MVNKWLPYPLCVFYCVVVSYLDIRFLMFWMPVIVIVLWFKLFNEATESKNGPLFVFALLGWPILFVALAGVFLT